MGLITEKLEEVRRELPVGVELVAVSKFHPESDVMEAYVAGQRVFGENIVQELRRKHEALPKDIKWHMIGHLQKNKVKYLTPFVDMIESVDSEELLNEINRHAEKDGRIVKCLLEVHVAEESTKSGFSKDALLDMLKTQRWRYLKHVSIEGLMAMATHTDDKTIIASDFAKVNRLFEDLKGAFFTNDEKFRYRSWGMSHDYKIALREGSNVVRIGTYIFGPRPQKSE